MSPPVRVLAPAKVNLWLEVTGKRDDGYHELETAILALDLRDEIELRAGAGAPGVHVHVGGPQAAGVPADGANLAARGALAAAELGGEEGRALLQEGIVIRVEKRVPAMAGLGGGSSDAAAAFLGVAGLLGLDPDQTPAARSLAALGSDCAFFLEARESGLAWCRGRGELVEPLPTPAPSCAIALVVPALTCSTRSVYAALRVPREPNDGSGVRERLAGGGLEGTGGLLFNRLEEAALASHPDLRAWRALLDRTGEAPFLLSGSGSSYFALFPDALAAEGALEAIAAEAQARNLGLRGRWAVSPGGAGASPASSK